MKSPTDVIEPDDMRKLAAAVDAVLPELVPSGERLGFAILIFNFGPGGNLQYISNAGRNDMIAAMREWLGHQSFNPHTPN